MDSDIILSETQLNKIHSRTTVHLIYPAYSDPEFNSVRKIQVYSPEDYSRLIKFKKKIKSIKPLHEIFLDVHYYRVCRLRSITSKEWEGALNIHGFQDFYTRYKMELEGICHIHALNPIKYNIKDLNKQFKKESTS